MIYTRFTIGLKNNNTLIGNSFNEAFGLKVSVSPNPARTWVAFTYELPNKESDGLIRITDISGNVIKKFIITGEQGQQVWDTRLVKTGVYIYTIISNGLSKTGKIVIN